MAIFVAALISMSVVAGVTPVQATPAQLNQQLQTQQLERNGERDQNTLTNSKNRKITTNDIADNAVTSPKIKRQRSQESGFSRQCCND